MYMEVQPIFIGRASERKTLLDAFEHSASRFVAVYGRRRVGKTYLIRQTLGSHMRFQLTGRANTTTSQQLLNFQTTLAKLTQKKVSKPKNWFLAFQDLITYLEQSGPGKKVVFIDELPWLATRRSDFLSALEHFWNSWASARTDVLLVVCGSSAAWMVNQLLRNKGGLHNRVTDRIRLEPWTLGETEAFLRVRNPTIDRYSVTQLYMVMGGIPFYLDAVSHAESAAQNIERLCFSESGLLRSEFDFMLQALFQKAEQHQSILQALSVKTKGLTRRELTEYLKIANSGRLTEMLTELEQSGFVQCYIPFGKRERDLVYRLCDFYTAFYYKFLHKTRILDEGNWVNAIDTSAQKTWQGCAFEQVCLNHTRQLKQALGVQGIVSMSSVWSAPGAQIDLLIDRKDRVINVFEIKFSEQLFTISKEYAEQLTRKIEVFKATTKTTKTIHLTMLTPFGLTQNAYAAALVHRHMEMDVLFE
jgi:uncharacterized protein